MCTEIEEKIKKTEAEIKKLQTEKQERDNIDPKLKECLAELSQNKVKELFLSMHDLQQIEKGYTTLMMLLFDKAVLNDPGQLEIYNEDASEIGSGLTSLRKIQRLFNMVDLNVFDTCEIGICFEKIRP